MPNTHTAKTDELADAVKQLNDPNVLSCFLTFFACNPAADQTPVAHPSPVAQRKRRPTHGPTSTAPRCSKRMRMDDSVSVPTEDDGESDDESEDETRNFIEYLYDVRRKATTSLLRTVMPGPRSLKTGFVR
ncbi:uncharacterized protein EHS24_003155 [Apiotrichum porosum]|uniref:Uncharacterized protein n=1 Tax=Apiotrichum porosum TaxID=105984 RepID=A0A427XFE1_9TREE|nr:uncharacterized protein EHS24_003155 [Apiotrichum porosum]RSH77595.1 hypothetical protein EHS24_003155 [Apiotrichum porosum]